MLRGEASFCRMRLLSNGGFSGSSDSNHLFAGGVKGSAWPAAEGWVGKSFFPFFLVLVWNCNPFSL